LTLDTYGIPGKLNKSGQPILNQSGQPLSDRERGKLRVPLSTATPESKKFNDLLVAIDKMCKRLMRTNAEGQVESVPNLQSLDQVRASLDESGSFFTLIPFDCTENILVFQNQKLLECSISSSHVNPYKILNTSFIYQDWESNIACILSKIQNKELAFWFYFDLFSSNLKKENNILHSLILID
jgi:hypothetical protein